MIRDLLTLTWRTWTGNGMVSFCISSSENTDNSNLSCQTPIMLYLGQGQREQSHYQPVTLTQLCYKCMKFWIKIIIGYNASMCSLLVLMFMLVLSIAFHKLHELKCTDATTLLLTCFLGGFFGYLYRCWTC